MRTWLGVLLVAFGAVARHAVNELCRRCLESQFGRFWPLSTLLVNVVGSFAIGWLMALFRRGQLGDGWRLFLLTGGSER